MKVFACLFVTFAFGTALCAQVGQASLNLFVASATAPESDTYITMAEGARLRINAPLASQDLFWTKNGMAIPGATGSVFMLSKLSRADAGAYTVKGGIPSTTVYLSVGGSPMRLTNSSTRAFVAPGERLVIGGFVVSGHGVKKVIVRAIGPSLALFGVNNPLPTPSLIILDSEGKRYSNAYVYLPVVGGFNYEDDLRNSLASVGAFAVPVGSKDAVEMRPFRPGNYTVHVAGAPGESGVVLLEVYEVP